MSLVVKVYDLESNLLADISSIALEKTLRRRHSAARAFVVQAPAGHSLLTTVAGDGYPNLRKGNRKLVVLEDGDVIFHGRIFDVERVGDGTKNRATITAFDPMMELGFDSEDRAGRPVRGSTTAPAAGDPFDNYDGNFISPQFASSVAAQDEISGPDLIYQVLTNSQNTGAESDPAPGEGPLPILVDVDNFDLDVPPAIDLSPSDTMDWPILIGDFIALLVDTGVVDVEMVPLDPETVADPYHMVEVFARSSIGTDRSGTVHFDYWTGSKNASAARYVESFATVNNKLYDYLGPQVTRNRWRANITPGSPGAAVDVDTSRTLYGGPGSDKGAFMSIRVFDSLGDESASRPLYLALWNAEQGYRAEPRDLLYVTPAPGSKALFSAPQDFDIGDLIAINTGAAFGVTLAESQRVYGYDCTWDRQGVKRLSQLLTSADVA